MGTYAELKDDKEKEEEKEEKEEQKQDSRKQKALVFLVGNPGCGGCQSGLMKKIIAKATSLGERLEEKQVSCVTVSDHNVHLTIQNTTKNHSFYLTLPIGLSSAYLRGVLAAEEQQQSILRENDTLSKQNLYTPEQAITLGKSESKKAKAGAYKKGLVSLFSWLILFLLTASGVIPSPLLLPGLLINLSIALITGALLLYVGKDTFKSAWKSAFDKNNRHANANTLVTLGCVSAWSYSLLIVIFPSVFAGLSLATYFSVPLLIFAIMHIGDYFKLKINSIITKTTEQNLKKLESSLPKKAMVWRDEKKALVSIDTADIKAGDIVLVKQGKTIPVNGKLIAVPHYLTQAQKTYNIQTTTHVARRDLGETTLKQKTIGLELIAGNSSQNCILIQATCRGDSSAFAKTLLKSKQFPPDKTGFGAWLDTLAAKLVYFVLAIALCTALVWTGLAIWGGISLGIAKVVTATAAVLLSACPCFIFVWPVSRNIGYRRLVDANILTQNMSALERASSRKKKVFIFDKTGTLTTTVVTDCKLTKDCTMDEKAVLSKLWQLESASGQLGHDIGKAIEDYCVTKNAPIGAEPADMKAQPFRKERACGIKAGQLLLGNLALMQKFNVPIPAQSEEKAEPGSQYTDIYFAQGKLLLAKIRLQNTLRTHAKETIRTLIHQGHQVYMATGDEKKIALDVAKQCGISESNIGYALTPQSKQAFAQNKQQAHPEHMLIAVGDGGNDIPLFEQVKNSNGISIAIAGGLSESGNPDFVVRGSLSTVTKLLDTAPKIYTGMKTMVVLGIALEMINMLFATGLFYPLVGFFVSPIISATVMGVTTLLLFSIVLALHHYLKRRLSQNPSLMQISERPARHSWRAQLKQSIMRLYHAFINAPRTFKAAVITAVASFSIAITCRLLSQFSLASALTTFSMANVGIAFCTIALLTGYLSLAASVLMTAYYLIGKLRERGYFSACDSNRLAYANMETAGSRITSSSTSPSATASPGTLPQASPGQRGKLVLQPA